MSFLETLGRLLGLSAYDRPSGRAALMPSLGDPEVDRRRAAWGGQLAPPPTTRDEWYLADLDDAERQADQGELALAAQLMRSARRDGILAGVLSTRTDGLVRLPKTFAGAPEIVAELESTTGAVRSTFDEIFPPSELALIAADGILLGVGVGELRPVPGRAHPVFVRLDPEWLRYAWTEGQWYYSTVGGELPITPGDGRWVLHTPGGRLAPWNAGIWKAIGRAFIRKEAAAQAKDNYEATVANPAIVAEAPNGASESIAADFFRRLANAWGLNTLFGLKPGYKLTLLESNGRGHESFNLTIADQNTEMTICVAGQTVTTEGGTGFVNGDLHKSTRADLIQSTADSLAYTVNSQGLPGWIADRWGQAALANPAIVTWDVTPPRDLGQKATALGQAANTITVLLNTFGTRLDVDQLALDYGIPLRALPAPPAPSTTQPARAPAGEVN